MRDLKVYQKHLKRDYWKTKKVRVRKVLQAKLLAAGKDSHVSVDSIDIKIGEVVNSLMVKTVITSHLEGKSCA